MASIRTRPDGYLRQPWKFTDPAEFLSAAARDTYAAATPDRKVKV